MCALASQETTGKSPGSKADHHVIAGWSGAVLDEGVLWLVLISFSSWGKVGRTKGLCRAKAVHFGMHWAGENCKGVAPPPSGGTTRCMEKAFSERGGLRNVVG